MRNVSLLLLLAISAQPALAQGFSEYGGVNALSAGLGAGLAGSLNHGRVIQQSYETVVEAQQRAALEAQALQTYFKQAIQYEKNKQWAYAETAFNYVLRLIARRDGPGSANSITVLSHLSKDCRSQKKLDLAINYQKTVVALTQAAKKPDPTSILTEQRNLSSLYMEKKDYNNAKSALQSEVALFDRFPTLPREQYTATLNVYGTVLHELHLDNQMPPATATATAPPAPAVEPIAVSAPVESSATSPPLPVIPAQSEPLTPEQEAILKANLQGSQPLPSEIEMARSMNSGQPSTPPVAATNTDTPQADAPAQETKGTSNAP
jgi:hypothetical protein